MTRVMSRKTFGRFLEELKVLHVVFNPRNFVGQGRVPAALGNN